MGWLFSGYCFSHDEHQTWSKADGCPGEQTASGHKMTIALTISCMPEPWQGRASARKQLLTEFWPLPRLTFPQDRFASEDFSLGLCPSSVFSSVSLPFATERIQLWPDPSSSSFLPKILRRLERWWHSWQGSIPDLLAVVGQSTLSPQPPNHNSRDIWNINMKLGMHT